MTIILKNSAVRGICAPTHYKSLSLACGLEEKYHSCDGITLSTYDT